VAQLDVDFRKFLEVRLAPYAGTFKLPTRGFDDVTKLEIAADAAPKDAKARAHVALGYYYGGDAEKAGVHAKQTLALDPKNPIARYIQAEIAMHTGNVAGAKLIYTQLMADGFDSYDFRARLAQIAQEEHDAAELEKQLCAAKKLDPEKSFPYQALAQLYKKQGKAAKYLAELETYAFIEQMEFGAVKELVGEYEAAKNWPKVRTYGEMGTYINTQDPEVLTALARAYLETNAPDKALYTYDTLLVVNPPPRRPALVHIGRTKAYAALNKMKEAKAALALALKTEPENADALLLKAQLK
jgi:tetratricopeptide (TPR) repeat protein